MFFWSSDGFYLGSHPIMFTMYMLPWTTVHLRVNLYCTPHRQTDSNHFWCLRLHSSLFVPLCGYCINHVRWVSWTGILMFFIPYDFLSVHLIASDLISFERNIESCLVCRRRACVCVCVCYRLYKIELETVKKRMTKTAVCVFVVELWWTTKVSIFMLISTIGHGQTVDSRKMLQLNMCPHAHTHTHTQTHFGHVLLRCWGIWANMISSFAHRPLNATACNNGSSSSISDGIQDHVMHKTVTRVREWKK